ncbi:UNVERIFIED_CONTAM: hypothetical protein RMT77_007244 [Armadillidium vulgare]
MDIPLSLSLNEYLNSVSLVTTPTTNSDNTVVVVEAVNKIIGDLNQKYNTISEKLEGKIEHRKLEMGEQESVMGLDFVSPVAQYNPIPRTTELDPYMTLPFETQVPMTLSTDTLLVNTVVSRGNIPAVLGMTQFSEVSHSISSSSTSFPSVSHSSSRSINDVLFHVDNRVEEPRIDMGKNKSTIMHESEMGIMKQQLSLLTNAVSMLTELVKNTQRPKAVPPGKYSYETGQDLNKFFVQFETFCQYHYSGSQRHWSQLLERYLEGSFLKLYLVINKTVDSYSEIKSIMLRWFQQEERHKNNRRLQEFMNANRLPGESINMLALRLEQLASKAFPGVDVRNHDALCTAFLLSLPNYIEKKVREYIVQTEVLTNRKVPWEQLVLLADQYEYDHNSQQPRPIIEHPVNMDNGVEVINIDTVVVKQPSWSDILRKKSSVQPVQSDIGDPEGGVIPKNTGNLTDIQVLPCTYCGIKGHKMDECYKFLGVCSYCKKKGHIRSECRITQSLQKPLSNFKNSCPFCNGPHLGINCDSRKLSGNKNNTHNLGKTNSNNFHGKQETKKLNEPTHHDDISSNFGNRGAMSKKRFIDDCRLCGSAHYEGHCLEEESLN